MAKGRKNKNGLFKKPQGLLLALILIVGLIFSGGELFGRSEIISIDDIPSYDGGEVYVYVNGGVPFFEDEKRDTEYEQYSELDSYGRCGSALACLGTGTMPKENEERKSISSVYPSGWQSVQYDIVSGKHLYNRSHLIGWQLSGENDNEKNLITGTRYFNVNGMLKFENMVADYIKETGERVLYRVTPVYKDNELVARGVLIEAQSAHDLGASLEFCVFVYNVQPGIEIDYLDGSSHLK